MHQGQPNGVYEQSALLANIKVAIVQVPGHAGHLQEHNARAAGTEGTSTQKGPERRNSDFWHLLRCISIGAVLRIFPGRYSVNSHNLSFQPEGWEEDIQILDADRRRFPNHEDGALPADPPYPGSASLCVFFLSFSQDIPSRSNYMSSLKITGCTHCGLAVRSGADS